MWDLPGPGIEPVSLALAGRFLTTGPPWKYPHFLFSLTFFYVLWFIYVLAVDIVCSFLLSAIDGHLNRFQVFSLFWYHEQCCYSHSCISSVQSLSISPVAYWAPTDLGSSSFSILSFCLFILFMGFSRQAKRWSKFWKQLSDQNVESSLWIINNQTHCYISC